MRCHRFTTYVGACPGRVWQALTDPAQTRRYYFGLAVDGDWRAGGAIVYRMPGGPERSGLHGRIVLIEAERLLMHDIAADDTWVTWEIAEPDPGLSRVTLTVDMLDHDDDAADAWNRMLCGLKTILETGHALAG